ncbi:MAG TPA: transposase, partial [Burkholderiaceae bacterium]|nr:transposase [Burkholderiaceae bacterium]
MRALLVKYLFDLSYRQTEERLDCDLLLKWFAGYSLFEPPPDHTTLHRFETWVFKHQFRLFFDLTMNQIEQHYPQERDKPQLVDTFAMIARGAKGSLITLLRQLMGQLLAELERLDPQRYTELCQALDLAALFGQAGEKITPALNVQERDERLQEVVGQVWRAWHWLTDSLDQAPYLPAERLEKLRTYLGYLDKIVNDETSLTIPDPEQPAENVTVTERPAKKKGAYRIAAANDPEATFRKHNNQEATFPAYNAAVLTTNTFVRETAALTGATPDPVPLPHMLQSQHQHHGFFPQKVIGDMAFGSGKTRALVNQVSQGQTQL